MVYRGGVGVSCRFDEGVFASEVPSAVTVDLKNNNVAFTYDFASVIVFASQGERPTVGTADTECVAEKLRVHWETQYRKIAEEPSCIRKPDTEQHSAYGNLALGRSCDHDQRSRTRAVDTFQTQAVTHSSTRFPLDWGSQSKTRKLVCCATLYRVS